MMIQGDRLFQMKIYRLYLDNIMKIPLYLINDKFTILNYDDKIKFLKLFLIKNQKAEN